MDLELREPTPRLTSGSSGELCGTEFASGKATEPFFQRPLAQSIGELKARKRREGNLRQFDSLESIRQ